MSQDLQSAFTEAAERADKLQRRQRELRSVASSAPDSPWSSRQAQRELDELDAGLVVERAALTAAELKIPLHVANRNAALARRAQLSDDLRVAQAALFEASQHAERTAAAQHENEQALDGLNRAIGLAVTERRRWADAIEKEELRRERIGV